MYNEHHKVYCLQFQAVVAPYGKIVDFLVPLLGGDITVTFLTKDILMKDLLKHNRDSQFSISTMQTMAILHTMQHFIG